MSVLNKVIKDCARIMCKVNMQTSKDRMLIKILPLHSHTTISWKFGQGYMFYTIISRGIYWWYWVCRALFLQTIESYLCLVQLHFQSFTFIYSKSTGGLHAFCGSFLHIKLPFQIVKLISKWWRNSTIKLTALRGSCKIWGRRLGTLFLI